MAGWLADGSLQRKFHIVDGLQNAPSALSMLFNGGNTGKLCVLNVVPDANHLRTGPELSKYPISLWASRAGCNRVQLPTADGCTCIRLSLASCQPIRRIMVDLG
jgi:hypothetical protein